MEKLLKPKDRILLSVSLLADIYKYFFPPISVWLRDIKGCLPPNYKTSNFYNAYYRSLKTGEIRKVVKKDKVYLELTTLGRKKLQRKFPLFKLQNKKWDGKWRIVIYDIKEKSRVVRRLLRMKLKSLGFGMWQQSVYISPFSLAEDIRAFLITHGLKDEAYVLVAKDLYGGDEKKLVRRIWKLDIINNHYRDLIDDWEWAKSSAANLPKEILKKEAMRFYRQYLELIAQDPFLPKDLLPDNWWAGEARKLVREWLSLL